jgi:hypothetical protein
LFLCGFVVLFAREAACFDQAALDLVACVPTFAQERSVPPPATGNRPQVERRILVLRAEDPQHSATETRVDLALGQALAEMGFIVNVSPMPFRDAQLALGCSGSVRACGGRVAAALDSEQLAVISLREQDRAAAHLALYLFAPGSERVDDKELPRDPGLALEATVRELARRVYGDAAREPASAAYGQQVVEPPQRASLNVASAPASAKHAPVLGPAPERPSNSALRAVGWSAATVGGALLLGGLATSLAANRAGDAYAQRKIRDQDDADVALANYARAEHQATVARVLFGTGGAVLLLGTTVLLWEHLMPSRRDRKVRLSAAPIAHGAFLSASVLLERRTEGGRW